LSGFIAQFVLANGKIHFPARVLAIAGKSGINHDELVLENQNFLALRSTAAWWFQTFGLTAYIDGFQIFGNLVVSNIFHFIYGMSSKPH